MNKKNVIIASLLAAIFISGVSTVILISIYPTPIQTEDGPTLLVGTLSGPFTLEIVDSWDSASNDVLEQVVETLFFYDLNDLDLPRINFLAESYFWENLTTLQIKLREGVRFHDETPFNAEAAKWNLDRLLYLTNCTGTKRGEIAHTQSLWMLPAGETPIINNIIEVGEFNITITLNAPYAPLLDALAYINAGMISPTAHENDAASFISLTSGKLIGTGPFKFIQYEIDKEVKFSRWEGYWRNLANFKTLKFIIYDGPEDIHDALINHQIDYAMGWSSLNLPTYENDSSITVKRFTDDTGLPGLVCRYFQFNTERLNETWRKALSYAINYNDIIKQLGGGEKIRATSMISPAFGAAHNASISMPEYNITKARQIMVSMGFGNMSWTDSQWIQVANSITPFKTIELQKWIPFYLSFELIGVDYPYCFFLEDSHNRMDFKNDLCLSDNWEVKSYDLVWRYCYPDYYDPFHILYNSLNKEYVVYDYNMWTPTIYKLPATNDPWINSQLELALETLDEDARNFIYKDIQWYISDVLHSHAFVYHNKILFFHSADLYGVPYNALGKFQAYGMRRG